MCNGTSASGADEAAAAGFRPRVEARTGAAAGATGAAATGAGASTGADAGAGAATVAGAAMGSTGAGGAVAVRVASPPIPARACWRASSGTSMRRRGVICGFSKAIISQRLKRWIQKRPPWRGGRAGPGAR
ncbi:hypothetical protein EI293_20525 [Hymenobacter perfusus]|uniref:Uncharacterized protein n=1 Tax=Hymenobacter perfusus TaxID=1236770 RepID=A0A428JXP7_9BACT|nr:hypothetical protein EI293_20525 [Hymenobacter perfusus]